MLLLTLVVAVELSAVTHSFCHSGDSLMRSSHILSLVVTAGLSAVTHIFGHSGDWLVRSSHLLSLGGSLKIGRENASSLPFYTCCHYIFSACVQKQLGYSKLLYRLLVG